MTVSPLNVVDDINQAFHNGVSRGQAFDALAFQSRDIQLLTGGYLVTLLAYMEPLVGKTAQKSWKYPNDWYAKFEFDGLLLIRHCFAHYSGEAKIGNLSELQNFIDKLGRNEVKDSSGAPVLLYAELRDDYVVLSYPILMRASQLCKELICDLGIVSCNPNETDWRKSN